jgi:hypothetical protein
VRVRNIEEEREERKCGEDEPIKTEAKVVLVWKIDISDASLLNDWKGFDYHRDLSNCSCWVEDKEC